MGNESQKRRDETRHDRNEVRCWAGESRCLAAAQSHVVGDEDIMKGFHHQHGSSSGRGSLVTPLSLRSLSADPNRR